MTEDRAADCARCPHSGAIKGELTLISCRHPIALAALAGPEPNLQRITNGIGPLSSGALHIRADAAGVTAGRFMWPSRFDPKYLLACRGCPPPDLKKQPIEPDQGGRPTQHVFLRKTDAG